jgi:N-acetylglucosamine kinase-like BadF-type ATPase
MQGVRVEEVIEKLRADYLNFTNQVFNHLQKGDLEAARIKADLAKAASEMALAFSNLKG